MADGELQFILKLRDEATAVLKAHGAAIGDAAGKAGELAEAHEEASRSLGEVVKGAQEATEAFVSMWATNELAKGAIEAFEDTERSLRAVEFQSNLTSAAIKELHEDLYSLSMRDGNATADQLLKISVEAAKLGGTKTQIADFAKAMSELGNSQNMGFLTGEITRTVEATGEGIGGAKKYAEALAALAKGSREGAEGIAAMTSMLAARTQGMDVDSLKLAAYAKTLESLGGIPRMSAGLLSTALMQLQIEGEKGGRSMQSLGERVGMTSKQMQDLAKDHPEAALDKLLTVVDKIKSAGNDPADFLEGIGIHGAREQQVIEALSARLNQLHDNEEKAKNAGQGSLDAISGKNTSDFETAVTRIDSAWTKLKEDVGSDIIGPVTVAFRALATAIDAVDAVFTKTPAAIRGTLEIMAIGGVTIGAAKVAFGLLKEALEGFPSIFALFGRGQAEAVEKSGVAATAIKSVGEAANIEAVEVERASLRTTEAMAAMAKGAVESSALTTGALRNIGAAANNRAGLGGAGTGGKGGQAVLGGLIGLSGAGSVYDAGYAVGETMKQQQQLGNAGVSTMDELRMLLHNIPLIGMNDKEITQHFQEQKDAGTLHTDNFKTNDQVEEGKRAQEQAEALERKQKEMEQYNGPMRRSATDEKDASSLALGDKDFRSEISAYDELIKKEEALTTETENLSRIINLLTPEQREHYADILGAVQRRIDLEKAALDPMNRQRDTYVQQLAAAQAFTKQQQDAAATEAKVFAARKAANQAGTSPDSAEAETRDEERVLTAAKLQVAFEKEEISLQQQLRTAASLTQADKDRAQIAQQMESMSLDKGYSAGQLGELQKMLELIQQVNHETEQFHSLNPQATALQNYSEQLDLLNRRLKEGSMNQAEFDREKTKLDTDTLSARDPIGAIVKSQQEEIDQLGIIGYYRDADRKTLQDIQKLKDQGIEVDKQTAELMKNSNRDVQDIQHMQGQIDQLTDQFGSGLSNAISEALSGNRHAWSQFGLSMGKSMMNMAFSDLAKQAEGALGLGGKNGLLGGMFGKAQSDNDALKAAAEAQKKKTMDDANPTIAHSQMMIENATLMINHIMGQGASNGAGSGNALPPPAGTPGGLGSTSAPSLWSPQSTALGTDHGLFSGSAEDFANTGPNTAGFSGNGLSGDMSTPSAWGVNMGSASGALGSTALNVGLLNSATGGTKGFSGNIQEAYTAARQAGLSDTAARALTANFAGEGLAVPRDVHWDGTHYAHGIGQWDDQRSAAIAGQFGASPNNLSVGVQTQAALWEMQKNPMYADSWNALHSNAAGPDMINTLVRNYERPGANQVDKALANRDNWFNKIHPQQAGVDMTPTGAVGGTGDQPYYVGDSIAERLRMTGHAQGDAVSSANTQQVLDIINGKGATTALGHAPGLTADLQGKTVVLSSGASNSPGNLDPVAAQIEALKAKGANVDLMGVGKGNGNVGDFDQQGINAKLALIAQQHGANFSGGLDQNRLDDGIHPNSAYSMDLVRQFGGTPGNPMPVDVATVGGNSVQTAGGTTGASNPTASLFNSLNVPQGGGNYAGAGMSGGGGGGFLGGGGSGGAGGGGVAIDGSGLTYGQVGNQVAGLGENALAKADPAAAPYIQGFNYLKSLTNFLPKGLTGGTGAASGGGLFGGLFGGGSAAASGGTLAATDLATSASTDAAAQAAALTASLGETAADSSTLFAGLPFFAGLFHTGGVVGGDFSMGRRVSPSVFSGAPRFHDGLGDDELPAILQRGERVLTAQQDQQTSRVMGGLVNHVQSTANSGGGGGRGGGSITMNINAPNPGSFRYSQPQITAQLSAAMSRASSSHR